MSEKTETKLSGLHEETELVSEEANAARVQLAKNQKGESCTDNLKSLQRLPFKIFS